MKKITISTIVASTVLATAGFVTSNFHISSANAQTKMDHSKMGKGNMNHSTMNHDQMTNNDAKMPTQSGTPIEPGQGAFASVAEIVAILTNDPTTDWDKVDINALREHLIDMDELILKASATTKVHGDKIVFTVTGSGRTLQAIRTMVPAHSGVLDKTTAWNVVGEATDTGAVMTILSKNQMALKVVKALGFYGVMATGAHHQPHHLAMAKGDTHVHEHN